MDAPTITCTSSSHHHLLLTISSKGRALRGGRHIVAEGNGQHRLLHPVHNVLVDVVRVDAHVMATLHREARRTGRGALPPVRLVVGGHARLADSTAASSTRIRAGARSGGGDRRGRGRHLAVVGGEDAGHLLKEVIAVGEAAKVDLLEDHLVLRQRARLVRQQVGDAPQIFGNGRRPRQRAGNLHVSLNHLTVGDAAHLQVDAQADGNDVAEEEHVAEPVDVPVAVEA